MYENKKILKILLTTESAEHVENLNTSLEFFSFLFSYSFRLTDTPQEKFFSKRQFPPTGELFSQNSNGARYLDAKYSRWISTDPALGEYVPLAPVNDEAKKHNQNLPGMGGLFNTVNLSLYHYAGNNPVKYTDPDGRTSKEDQAREMLYEASAFIINNAETEKEKIVANVVKTMMNNKKVQLDDFSKREPRKKGGYGFYDPRNNTVTNKPRDIIVLDIDMTVDNGLAELIDTLSHEATHAAHFQRGHKNNKVAEEIETWNMGLVFSNKYRKKNNLVIEKSTPYTYNELKYYEKVYNEDYDPNNFKEL